ncbi:MAG: helicase-related protein [Kiritimatiellia bacterium]
MPTIYDNIHVPFLSNDEGTGLREALSASQRGDFCVGYFNLRGWKAVDDLVEAWPFEQQPVCRLLVGMQRLPQDDLRLLLDLDTGSVERLDNKRAAQIKRKLAQDFRKQLTIGIPTRADEAGLRRLRTQLTGGRLQVKLFLRHPLHAKLYLAHRQDKFNPVLAYLGSSNLTFSGLRGQGELNIDVADRDAAGKLLTWFNDRWADPYCVDITEDLIEIIGESWAGERLLEPWLVYLKMAWHLSRDARDGIKEFRVPHDVRDELLPFQVKAVQLACRHLNKRGGVLVGDVVGLGKTRVASAIARILGDDQMLETLILCPKNLTSMWEEYAHRFKLRAPKVLSQSLAQRELPNLPRYRLIIVDESHNFRNREGKAYQAIREYIERNDSKVILLTATPYNKTYLDLASQLRLFLPEQSDIGIRPETLLREIGEVDFSLHNPNTPLSSLAAFEQSPYPDDWREVMRLFLVRRTRSFILQNYAETDERNQRPYLTLPNGIRVYFPERVPRTIAFRSDPQDLQDPCARLFRAKVVDDIESLDLPRYGLSKYLKPQLPPDLRDADEKLLKDLSRAGKRLMGFCRTNMFKRLESSGEAFLLSLHRHVLRNHLFLHALENELPLPIGKQDIALLDTRYRDSGDGELDLDGEEEELPPFALWEAEHYRAEAARIYARLAGPMAKRFRWLRTDVFKKTLRQHLQRDADTLHALLLDTGNIPTASDFKLQALITLLRDQHPREKFLIFTQFADTASYLSRALKAAGLTDSDCVTGNSDNPAAQAWRFSPESNEKAAQYPPSAQTRVLIATDVLSEGQNLQDASRVINYDLPWAIIRLIQRAGRVDRIGQLADRIHCYSFLPAQGVEDIIGLRKRLTQRLHENEEVVGSDEAFFEHQSPHDEEALRNLYNEQSGVLDEPADDEVDLTSEAYEIWSRALKEDASVRARVENLPDVVYATKAHTPDPERPEFTPPGTLVYIRTKQDNDALVWMDPDKRTASESPVRVLRAAACRPDTPALLPRNDHHELVAEAVRIVHEERRDIGAGQLGSRRGARYRAYERLQDFLKHREGDLFLTDQVRAAIQAIYDHPLTTHAVDKLNRQLRSGINDEDLAELVTTLHQDDRLVIVGEPDDTRGQTRILCSMGLRELTEPL